MSFQEEKKSFQGIFCAEILKLDYITFLSQYRYHNQRVYQKENYGPISVRNIDAKT